MECVPFPLLARKRYPVGGIFQVTPGSDTRRRNATWGYGNESRESLRIKLPERATRGEMPVALDEKLAQFTLVDALRAIERNPSFGPQVRRNVQTRVHFEW